VTRVWLRWHRRHGITVLRLAGPSSIFGVYDSTPDHYICPCGARRYR
jgi:hypothetical protein